MDEAHYAILITLLHDLKRQLGRLVETSLPTQEYKSAHPHCAQHKYVPVPSSWCWPIRGMPTQPLDVFTMRCENCGNVLISTDAYSWTSRVSTL